MNVLSLFDGMSCGRIALDRANIEVDTYYASEIDRHAIAVSQDNFPDIVRLGDVTKWKKWEIDWSSIDLIMAGSPCQGFSFAGKQLAFNDPRSKLFFVFVDILTHIRTLNPNVKFLLENVKMKKEYLDVISGELGVAPININSALVSAQNRNRYYWCNWKVTEPVDKNITWGDVREYGVSSESYYYTEAASMWLGRSSRKRGKHLTVHSKKYSNQRFFEVCNFPSAHQRVAAMRGRYLLNGVRQDGKGLTAGKTKQYIEFRYDGKTNALTTVGKDNVVVPFTLPDRVPATDFFFRYVTVLECERLQTVPDNYTQAASNTQRYKMLGNGWTVDVIVEIFKGIANGQSHN